MPNRSVEPSKRRTRPLSREIRENDARERTLIRASARRWEKMDETARELGRGLGRRELLDRVALEVGKSLRQVHAALKTSS